MGKAYQSRDIQSLLHYNGLDTVATSRAFNEMLQEPEWKEPRVQRLWQIHVRLAKIAARMHTRGFAVNQTTRAALSAQLTQMHEERKVKLMQHVADPEFGATPVRFFSQGFDASYDTGIGTIPGPVRVPIPLVHPHVLVLELVIDVVQGFFSDRGEFSVENHPVVRWLRFVQAVLTSFLPLMLFYGDSVGLGEPEVGFVRESITSVTLVDYYFHVLSLTSC